MVVELGEAVEECGGAAVGDAVDVAVGLGDVVRIDGRELGGDVAGGGEDLDCGSGLGNFAGGRFQFVGDVGEAVAGLPGAGGVAFLAEVGASAGGGGEQVVEVEALEDADVSVAGEIGDDVRLAWDRGGGLFVGVHRVEGVKSGRSVCGDDAVPSSADDVPPAWLFGIQRSDTVQDVTLIQERHTPVCVVRAPYAKDDIVRR